MKVSVVIPVYNVERYLSRCLDSVLASARQFLAASEGLVEVICVNDGSTDGSAAILERYREAAEPTDGLSFLVLTKPTGDYVTFVDSDDWIPAAAISTFAAVADASRAALVVSSSFVKEDGAGLARPEVRAAAPGWRLRPTPWIAGRKVQYCAWNKLYRADLFGTRRYPATIYEDFPVTTDILCAVGAFALVDAPLYIYCTNAGAASLVRSTFTPRKLKDSIAVVRMVLETARRQEDPGLRRFALRQAADGHSSTVGQVWKTGERPVWRAFLAAHEKLMADYPELSGKLRLKAACRLWRMKRA